MTRHPHRLDGSAEQCQPCETFTHDPDDPCGMENVHECLAPFDGTHPCAGTVSFCWHCNRDHHVGGYNACLARAGSECPRHHPACLARRAAEQGATHGDRAADASVVVIE